MSILFSGGNCPLGSGSSGGSELSGTPQWTHVSSSGLVAGASVDLSSDQITVNETGTLVLIYISATVAFDAVIKMVNEAVETDIFTVHNSIGGTEPVQIPNAGFFTVLGTAAVGFDGFTVSITNCDRNASGNVSVTFLWTEM